jgi:hypothetical protein
VSPNSHLVASLICLLDAVAAVLTPPHPEDASTWDRLLVPGGAEGQEASSSTSPPQQPQGRRFHHGIFRQTPQANPATSRQFSSRDLCLRVDGNLMAQRTARHLLHCTQQGGYLRVQLTKTSGSADRSDRGVFEYAHRLVAWCIYGPPPSQLGMDAVVMHTCNRADCLNPDHLAWGNRSQNWPR